MLKAFNKNRNYDNKMIDPKAIILFGVIVVGLIGLIIYQSYALYILTERHNIANGEVGTFTTADIKIAVYVDGEKTNLFPGKTDGKEFEKLVCTNSGKSTWDNLNWVLDIKDIVGPTNCNVYFVDKSKTLGYKILNQEIDAATIEAKGNPDMSVVPTALTSGIYATEDEYGMSYYYRGEKDSLANNVIFAEHQWKVVRINGDGSIRLIYNGVCPNNSCAINSDGVQTAINNGIAYAWNITNANDAKYGGYMYGGANGDASTSKGQAQTNETDSNAKTILDAWYVDNIQNTEYERYVTDNIFCNDRSIETGTGYGSTVTYYKGYNRLLTNASNPTPTLKCEQKNDRFTVSNTKLGNGALTYPIGLIAADEAQYAGTGQSIYSTNQYLYTAQSYWTFSPYAFNDSISFMWIVALPGFLYTGNVAQSGSLRAVLNLTSGLVVTGDGTVSNPFVVTN